MAANKIQYVLGISADTSQAKKAINELQLSFDKVRKINLQTAGIDADLNKAAEAADRLQQHLQAAVNVNTGKLNLLEFNNSLKASGESLSELVKNLSYGGQVGQQAFASLASAIARTEIPLKAMNSALSSAMTTLSNTVKWQLSSNIVHGLQGVFSGAISYAENLNKTLTDIRIVTGMSTDEMAKFAVGANEAAKSLSTTTQAYANASLIYFQQGDSMEEAAKKAALTVKAANVAFTASAQEMSEMLTAVWNSYQVGTDQLEHVIDVMAALGATTASSMEEMATAMQKVASTANTVGVSMEQMSAIVATSASVTRQAPETVGTAWNTILSRIGGLKLGKTLEDGVDLNKYSNALKTVGINILDTTGNLREMGTVINELGNRWSTLSTAQQAALAQTIGGARQYTQIMAFFENFDQYQKNLVTAANADGELQRQQEIFAEGWEAASKRLQASFQAIYKNLIDDKTIIAVTNNITKLVDGVNSFIETLGGAKGVISTVGSLLLLTFSDRIVAQVQNIGKGIANFFSDPKQQYTNVFKEITEQLMIDRDATNEESISATQKLLQAKQDLLEKEHLLNDAQKETLQNSLNGYQESINLVKELESVMVEAQQSVSWDSKQFNKLIGIGVSNGSITNPAEVLSNYSEYQKNSIISDIAFLAPDEDSLKGYEDTLTGYSGLKEKIDAITPSFKALQEAVQGTKFETWLNAFDLSSIDDNGLKSLLTIIQQIGEESSRAADSCENKLRVAIESIPDSNLKNKLLKVLDETPEAFERAAESTINFNQAIEKSDAHLKRFQQGLESVSVGFNQFVNLIGEVASGFLALSRFGSTVGSAMHKLSSSSASTSEKMGALSSTIFQAVIAIGALKKAMGTLNSVMNLGLSANIVTGIGAGVGVLATAIMAYQSWSEEQKKIAQEQIKTDNEVTSKRVSANQELIDTQTDLLSTYNDLYNRYIAGEEVQEELATSAEKLAEAYGITGVAVAKLTGDFEKFNSQVRDTVNFDQALSEAKNIQSYAAGVIGRINPDRNNSYNSLVDGKFMPASSFTLNSSYLRGYLAQSGIDNTVWENDRLSVPISQVFKELYNKGTEEQQSNIRQIIRDYTGKELKQPKDLFNNFKAFNSENILSQLTPEFIGNDNIILDIIDKIINEIYKGVDLPNEVMQQLGFLQSNGSNRGWEEYVNATISNTQIDLTNNGKFKNLIDEQTGQFKWNSADADEASKLYSQYQEWTAWLQEKINTAANEEIADYYETLKNDIDTFLETPELGSAITNYQTGQQQEQRLQIIQKVFNQINGKSSLNDIYDNYMNALEQISESYTIWPQLREAAEQYGQESVQFNNAVQKIASELLIQSGAPVDSTDIVTAIISEWQDSEQQQSAIKLLMDNNITQVEQLNSQIWAALVRDMKDIKTQFPTVSLSEIFNNYDMKFPTLAENNFQEYIEGFIELLKNTDTVLSNKFEEFWNTTSQDFQAYGDLLNFVNSIDENHEYSWLDKTIQIQSNVSTFNELSQKSNLYKDASSKLKANMTVEEAGNFYSTYFANNPELDEQWESFASKTLEEQQAFLDEYSNNLNQTTLEAAQTALTNIESLQSVYQKNFLPYLQDDETFDTFWERSQNILNNYLSDSKAEEFNTTWYDYYKNAMQDLVGTTKVLVPSLEDIKYLLNFETESASLESFIKAMELLQNKTETATDKMARLVSAIKQLPTDTKELKKLAEQLGVSVEELTNLTSTDLFKYLQEPVKPLKENFETEEAYTVALSNYLKQIELYDQGLNAYVKDLTESAITPLIQQWEKSISNLETRISNLMKIGKSITFENIQTGILTNEQEYDLNKVGFLDVWKTAKDSDDRYNIQRNILQTALGEQEYLKESRISGYTKASEELKNTSTQFITSEMKGNNDNWAWELLAPAIDKIPNDQNKAAIVSALHTAFTNAIKDPSILSGTSQQLSERMQQELDSLTVIATGDFDEGLAEIKDLLVNLTVDHADIERQTAAEVVDIWANAYQEIADLRVKLLSGENIASEITNSFDSFLNAYINSAYDNINTFWRDARSGDINADSFKLPEYSAKDMRISQGLSPFLNSNKTGILSLEDFNKESALSRIAQDNRLNLEIETDRESANGILRQSLDTMLSPIIKNENLRLAKINDYMNNVSGSSQFIYDAACQINDAATLFGQAVDNVQKQQEQDVNFQHSLESGKLEAISKEEEQQQSDLDLLNKARDRFDKDTHGLRPEDFSPEERDRLEKLTGEEFGRIKLDQLNNSSDTAAQSLYNLAMAAESLTKKSVYDSGYRQFDGEWHNTIGEGISETEYNNLTDAEERKKYELSDDGLFYEKGKKAEGVEETLKNVRKNAESAGSKMAENDSKDFSKLAQAVNMTDDEFKDYINTQKELGNIVGATDKELEQNAALLARQTKGFDEAQKNMSSYMKTLKKTNSGSTEHSKTLTKMRNIYADLFDLTEEESEHLSDGFIESTENAELLEKAIKGDEKAWDKLSAAAAEDIFSHMDMSKIVDPEGVMNNVTGLITDIQSYLDNKNLEVGADLNDAPFMSKLSSMTFQSRAAAEQMTAALSSIGVEAKIEEVDLPIEGFEDNWDWEGSLPLLKGVGMYNFPLFDTQGFATHMSETRSGHTEKFYKITGAKYNGRGVTHGGASSPTKGGGGGGGGKGKEHVKKEHKRVKDEGERYHQIRDKMEQQEHLLDRIDKIKDRAYGGRHLKALNAEIGALEKQNKLQKEYYAEAAAYLASDRAELTSYGAVFNSDGTINYEDYIRKQVDWYNAQVDASDNDETDKIIEEEYQDRIKALSNYEEALDLVDTIQNDILENENKISEILLEGVQYKLDIAVDLNDRDLQKLDYYINKWSEVLSKQDESMEVSMMKMGDYESSLAAVGKAYQELQKGYAQGRLNDQDYSDGLADLQDKTLEYLENIQDLKKEIEEYYENTLSLAEEKQQKYTDKIEHTRNMMQSYIEMQQLMGRGQNFAELNSMYDTSYRSSLLTARAARDYLDTLYASRAAIVKEIEDSGWTETLKAQYDSVEEHIVNAEDDLAQKTQQTLDDAKQKFMNVIDAIIKASDLAFKSLVDANGNLIKSFDDVAQDFNYWNEQQGWYVSTAKELYEVSKINRQIEDSLIDSTTATSKERLKALQNEINAYAEKNRLTEYDIEMNELQYKMALAMQDLEDTQNAKSTVRLTRDENGNYGYQYTANEDDVDEARQNFEDVLQQINELAYEHQNDLVQQMIESKQNYQSELREILDNDTLSLEERNRQAETLTEQHLAQMEYIQEQGLRAQEQLLENQGYIQEYYGQTIIENTGLVQDQIHGMMQQLIQDSSGYVEYIRTTLRQQLDEAIGGYSHDIDKVGSETGLTWGTMENSVSVYNKTNEKAAEDIKTLDQILGDSLKNISSATDSWVKHNAALETTIGNYEQLLNKMQGLQRSLVDIDSINDRYYNNGAIYRPSEMGTTAALNSLYNNKNATNLTEDRFEGSANALSRLHNTTMSEYDISTSNLWNLIDSGAVSNLLGLISRGVNPNVINGNTNGDALSQVVNINASFDNIQSAQDIIDAFNQLTNLASQYAYSSGS